MLLTNDLLKKWADIVDQVDKDHVPIACVKKVVFRDRLKKQKTINLKRLRSQGLTSDMIEEVIEGFIRDHEDDIVSMEFMLDIEAVATQVQPQTDKLLKDI